MYFWDIRGLRADLARRPLPQPEQLRYLIGFLVVHAPPLSLSVSGSWISWVSWTPPLLIAVGGCLYGYRCNGGDAGSDYLARVVSSGFVVGIRLGVVLLLLSPVVLASISFLASRLSQEPRTGWAYATMISASVVQVIFWALVGRNLGQIADETAA